MAQPIQEPTDGREVEGLAFRSRQLFRRPGSFSTYVVQNATYNQVGPPTTIPHDTPTIITFDTDAFWDSSDNWAIAGNEPIVHNPLSGTADALFIYQPGVYFASCAAVWEPGEYAKQTRLLHHQDGGVSGYGSLDMETADGWSGTFFPPLANGLLTVNPIDAALEVAHWEGHFYHIGNLDGIPDKQWQLEVHHTAGSDRDILGATLGCFRLAHVDGQNAS